MKEYQKAYKKAYKKAVEHMSNYYNENKNKSDIRKLMIREYRENNLDPDGTAIRLEFGVKCTADGLHSMKRICDLEKNIEDIIPVYKEYRKIPIFFFPSECGGINTSRSNTFNDRIDHTLYDLKMHFTEKADGCKLKKAYDREKTSIWLKEMGSFENIINRFGVKGIFTDDDYNVFDLESDEGRIISSYKSSEEYKLQWTDCYYKNLKGKIREFYANEANSVLKNPDGFETMSYKNAACDIHGQHRSILW